MSTQNHLERAEALLAQWIVESNQPQPNRLDFDINTENLIVAVSALVNEHWGYLAAITGLDPGAETGTLWVLYHFAEGAAVITLKVTVPRDNPTVPSIRGLIPLAGIFEKELSEILGVTPTGVTQEGRLFLPDDWPEDVYPMRKDFVGL